MSDKRSVWADGDILYSDDLSDSFWANKWYTAVLSTSSDFSGTEFRGAIGHATSKISIILDDGDIWYTADSGENWVEKNTTLSTTPFFIKNAKANKAYGIAVENGASADTSFTADSGVAWSDGGDLAATVTAVNDLSVPTTILAVVGVADSNGDTIQRSVDNGANWIDATTSPSAEVYAVDMFDGTTGFAIDSAGNIWKTTDSADTWADTGHQIAGGAVSNNTIFAISATVFVHTSETGAIIGYYDGTGNAITIMRMPDGMTTNFYKLTNGSIYMAAQSGNSALSLFKSTNGLNWKVSTLPFTAGAWGALKNKGVLSEEANDTLLLLTSISFASNIIKIVEED